MKIYLAGASQPLEWYERVGDNAVALWSRTRRLLFSYYYCGFERDPTFQKHELDKVVKDSFDRGIDLFLDSGAFTAFTKSREIPIEVYARYVKWSARAWSTASSLDAIGSGEEAAQKSYDNFIRLRELDARVQPVYHIREPEHWLQRYIDEGYDYIFIGGMVPENRAYLKPRLDNLWTNHLTHADGTAKVKIHGFGLTDNLLMFRYPWFSVDSTRWLMRGIYGHCFFAYDSSRLGVPLHQRLVNDALPPATPGAIEFEQVFFSEKSPEKHKVTGRHFDTLVTEEKEEVRAWLDTFHVTPEELATSQELRCLVNAVVLQQLEDHSPRTFQLEQPTFF